MFLFFLLWWWHVSFLDFVVFSMSVLHDISPLRLSGFYCVLCCKNLELQHSRDEPWFFLFFAQDELFSKNKRELKSKEGKTLERSNTEFFSLRRHVTNPGVNDAMVNIIILKCKTKTNGSVKVNQWPKHFAVTRGRDPLLVGRKNNDRSGRFPIT